MRQLVAALEKAGYRVEAETEGHIKMVKLIDQELLRFRTVLVPRPVQDGNLAVGSLNAILEQTGLGRAQLDASLLPQEESTDPLLRLHLMPLADRRQEDRGQK